MRTLHFRRGLTVQTPHVPTRESEDSKAICSLSCEYRLLPNPCVVDIQGVSFALSTVDVLFHPRKEELFKRVEEPEGCSFLEWARSRVQACDHAEGPHVHMYVS